MAKDTADNQTTEFSYEGLYNDDNPIESLSDLDLGDEVETDEAPTEEPEPVDESETSEDEAAEDEAGEEELAEDGEPDEEPAEETEEPEDKADDAPADKEDTAAQAETAKAKQPFIPKSRFDQRTAQLRAAERALEETQQKLREMETAKQRAEREASTLSDEQIQEKMAAANAALLEGNTDEAAKLQSEVFGALRQGSQAVEESTGQQVDPNKIAADVRDQMTFEQTLEKLYTDFPMLDENSEQFDEAVSQEAVELQSFYYQQGYTRAEATERAAMAVSRIHGLQSSQTQAPEPQVNKKADMAKRAQTEAKRSKLDKARKAPPVASAGRGSNDTNLSDVDALTVEDWSALPDSVRSRLLGDTL